MNARLIDFDIALDFSCVLRVPFCVCTMTTCIGVAIQPLINNVKADMNTHVQCSMRTTAIFRDRVPRFQDLAFPAAFLFYHVVSTFVLPSVPCFRETRHRGTVRSTITKYLTVCTALYRNRNTVYRGKSSKDQKRYHGV